MVSRSLMVDLSIDFNTRHEKMKTFINTLYDSIHKDWLNELQEIYPKMNLMLAEFHEIYCDYDRPFVSNFNDATIKSMKEVLEKFSHEGSIDSTALFWKHFIRFNEIVEDGEGSFYYILHIWRLQIFSKINDLKNAIDETKKTIAHRPPILKEFVQRTSQIKLAAQNYKNASTQGKMESLHSIEKLLKENFPKQWSENLKQYRSDCESKFRDVKEKIEKFQKWLEALLRFESFDHYMETKENLDKLIEKTRELTKSKDQTPTNETGMRIMIDKLLILLRFVENVVKSIKRILRLNVPLKPIDELIDLMNRDHKKKAKKYIELLDEYKDLYPQIPLNWIHLNIRCKYVQLLDEYAPYTQNVREDDSSHYNSIYDALISLNYLNATNILFYMNPYDKELEKSIDIRMLIFEMLQIYKKKARTGSANIDHFEELMIKFQEKVNEIKAIRATVPENQMRINEFLKALDESAFDKFTNLQVNLAKDLTPVQQRLFLPFMVTERIDNRKQ